MPTLAVRQRAQPAVRHRLVGDSTTIGRAPACDIVLEDGALSRVHAEILRTPDGWILRDRGSRNGTLLNGERVFGDLPLGDGDRIELGMSQLVFEGDAGPRPDSGEVSPTLPLREAPAPGAGHGRLVGRSPQLRAVRELLERVAPSDATLLVLGESGTGKELVSRALHDMSPRRDGPFVVVNCPALPEGLVDAELFGVESGVATGVSARAGRFEMARGGTLMLDEIGDLALPAQAKILRFLEDRIVERVGGRGGHRVDVRVVAATNADLRAAVARGAFRADLYHRLDEIAVELPPLRERREDIPDLVSYFLAAEGGSPVAVAPPALDLLVAHDYPGNVRELLHVLRRARLLCRGGVVRPEDLPRAFHAGHPGGTTAATAEGEAARLSARLEAGESFWEVVREPYLGRRLGPDVVRLVVRKALERAGGSYRRMAEDLGLAGEYKKLVNFLRNHGLRPGD